MKIKFVFFDAGNTLLKINYEFIHQVLADKDIEVDLEDIVIAECKARVLIDRTIEKNMENALAFKRYIEFIIEGIEDICSKKFKNKIFEEIFKEIDEYNKAHLLWTQPAEYAKQTLIILTNNNFRTGVISNSDGRIKKILTKAGLAKYLDVIIDSAVVGVEKPNVEIFKIALREAGVSPQEAIYVGDIYSIDILGCEKAGILGVLLDPIGEWDNVKCVKVKNIKEFTRKLMSGKIF